LNYWFKVRKVNKIMCIITRYESSIISDVNKQVSGTIVKFKKSLSSK